MTENQNTKTFASTNGEDLFTISINKKKIKKIAIVTGSALAAVGTVAFLTNISASVEGDLSIEPALGESENDGSTTE